ncbi:MAG TPA: DUF4197 domain-containing protein [Saprospiraceae bacterium]|jgi:hypothetical protein|nr:DUF4197 domain-containing protein [Saprospiraceae bacterium]HQU96057.1 DUF4197 domain-containing protein [Saprospiraceae bacterium]HQW95702.1 DUF4197 domain-containing protein [Saprospiraceae bacterium]
MKYILMFIIPAFLFVGCAELQQFVNTAMSEPTNAEVSDGLKEALNIGISNGADRLSAKDGYFKSAYKILLPPEARKVTDRLQAVPGFSDVENVILEKINRGAEDAATKAKPIFIKAIKSMTISDVINILMGADDAATQYLKSATYSTLYSEFNPVIVNSLNKFNAIEYWAKATNAYNSIPLVKQVNPRLDDYVTNQALDGLFKMVANEEKEIRRNPVKRVTELLKKVFAKQDSNRS